MNVSEKQNKNILPVSPFVLRAEEINQLVAELQYIITLAELVPDSEDTTQVWEALQILFATFSSTQIIDDNGENEKTQAERNREYEAALTGGVTLAYPECYLCGGLLTYNSTSVIDIASSKSRSSDNTKNIEVAGASLNITTNANWASGTAPTLTSLVIYVWAVYNSGSPIYLFDDVSGTNITGEKRLVAKFKTNASSQIISATLIDFSIDTNSAIARNKPDYTAGVSKDLTLSHTADSNGIIIAQGSIEVSGGSVWVNINGEIISLVIHQYDSAILTLPVKKGDVYLMGNTPGGFMRSLKFYPDMGNI